MEGKYKAMPIKKRHKAKDMYDTSYTETRYEIVNTETGKVVDDAQGYGYRTAQKAYAAWAYKHRTPEQKKARKEKDKIISEWMKHHKSFVKALDTYAFEITKGSWGPDDKVDANFIREVLEEYGYKDLPFTLGELLRYWEKH